VIRRSVLENRVVVAICAAQATAQVGTFAVPALLPTFITEWSLSNTEAGWIAGIYYAGYTLCVPVLASLTDRIDAKRVYVASTILTTVANLGYAPLADGFWSAFLFRALMGVGWAGTYMPGLKALSPCRGDAAIARGRRACCRRWHLGCALVSLRRDHGGLVRMARRHPRQRGGGDAVGGDRCHRGAADVGAQAGRGPRASRLRELPKMIFVVSRRPSRWGLARTHAPASFPPSEAGVLLRARRGRWGNVCAAVSR
jgi:hypothetical protein